MKIVGFEPTKQLGLPHSSCKTTDKYLLCNIYMNRIKHLVSQHLSSMYPPGENIVYKNYINNKNYILKIYIFYIS